MDAARARVRTCVTSERVGSEGVVVAKRRREKKHNAAISFEPDLSTPLCVFMEILALRRAGRRETG